MAIESSEPSFSFGSGSATNEPRQRTLWTASRHVDLSGAECTESLGLRSTADALSLGTCLWPSRGESADGHTYVAEAISRGAAAVAGEDELAALVAPYVRLRQHSAGSELYRGSLSRMARTRAVRDRGHGHRWKDNDGEPHSPHTPRGRHPSWTHLHRECRYRGEGIGYRLSRHHTGRP